MASRAVKMLVIQAHRLLGLALERWHQQGDDELQVDGVVDEDLVKQERLRAELRRRGLDV